MSTTTTSTTTPTVDVPSTVADLMTGDLITLLPIDSAARAHELLVGAGLHALPVVDERGEALGMVTMSEIGPEPDLSVPVGDLMVRPVVTIGADATIGEAAALMRDEFIHHLVVTEGDTTVGILSTYDLLFVLASR